MTKLPVTPLIRQCLKDIRAGRVGGVLLLADHLEEIKHPRRQSVRRAAFKWERNLTWCRTADFSKRRNWTRWEAVAAWHRWVRRRLLTILGAKTVRPMLLQKLYRLNEGKR